ncbi:hypothetical protein L798_13493 [Zootermopsis nevadensis]|uniref:Uncharacterized protein n=1 Tax=Zootermopsis nevadensis TaxID=136037 RepID=A0A067QRN7_ZOONE|nr:hypothetical protein L798_13493 [Zootermopsis nevadensis]
MSMPRRNTLALNREYCIHGNAFPGRLLSQFEENGTSSGHKDHRLKGQPT